MCEKKWDFLPTTSIHFDVISIKMDTGRRCPVPPQGGKSLAPPEIYYN